MTHPTTAGDQAGRDEPRPAAGSRVLPEAATPAAITRRSVLAATVASAAVLAGGAGSAVGAGAPPMRRGFNTFPWLYRAATLQGDPTRFVVPDANPWPYLSAFTADGFRRLRALGADVIRIPVEPSPLLAAADEVERARWVEGVLDAAERVTAAGLTAIVDLHPRDTVPAWASVAILQSDDLKARYRATVAAFAGAMRRRVGPLVLELMNEPPGGFGWRDRFGWFPFQEELVRVARAAAPDLPLLLQGDRGGGIDGLARLDPPTVDDPAILYSFHYYVPMVVTHQGADWGQNRFRRYLSGIGFPPDPAGEPQVLEALRARIDADPAAADRPRLWRDAGAAVRDYYASGAGPASIAADLGRVSAWAASHGIPASRLFMGEFGAFRPGADRATVVAYAAAVRRAAESAGFGWAYWNYAPFDENGRGFSVLTMSGADPTALDPELFETGLGLARP